MREKNLKVIILRFNYFHSFEPINSTVCEDSAIMVHSSIGLDDRFSFCKEQFDSAMDYNKLQLNKLDRYVRIAQLICVRSRPILITEGKKRFRPSFLGNGRTLH